MYFEWDEAKNEENIRKHGIDFADVVSLFNQAYFEKEDCSEEYGESRWTAIGWIYDLLGVVVYTEREGDVVRIISARKATKSEVRFYEQYIKN